MVNAVMREFVEFAEAAYRATGERSKSFAGATDDMARFGDFIAKADAILACSQAEPVEAKPAQIRDATCDSFDVFASTAVPILTRDALRYLRSIAHIGDLLTLSLTTRDVLAASGLSYDETAYVNLIAWALDPATHPDMARRLQSAWLRHLGLGDAIAAQRAGTIRTQIVTESGVVDAVLLFENAIVIVEAKTGTTEHDVGVTGERQTVVYPREIHAALECPSSVPVYIVLLAPEHGAPANPQARTVTYAELALLFCLELDAGDVSSDLRASLALIAAHFAHHAVPRGCAFGSVLQNASRWLVEADREPSSLVSYLHDIASAQAVAPTAGKQ